MNQLIDHAADMGQAKMFSKAWYNEYFGRAASSPTHARFCELVYGRNLCQHGMMDMAELDSLISLLKPGKILEIGGSNGCITEYIHQHVVCSILGIDYADIAIAQAQNRIPKKTTTLNFQCVDLIQDKIPGESYEAIMAIDSIYFMGAYKATLAKLNAKLNRSRRMIIAAFQAKEHNDSDTILLPDQTDMARTLQALSFYYSQHDITANIRNHWLKNFQFAQALQSDFAAEENEFLYEARMAENGWFKDHAERGTLVRFMDVIDHNPNLA